MDEKIEQFCAITGVTDAEQARSVLTACNGSLEMAVGMQIDGLVSTDTTDTSGVANPAAVEEDDVRAPIPQKHDILVAPEQSYHMKRRRGNPDSVFDRFRDFQAEARQQELRMNGASTSQHMTKLEDLFRPPIELIHNGPLASAQALAKKQNKWVLVNIQKHTEFVCQALNRDIWRNSTVRSLVAQHFILWQVYHDSEEGRKFTQFYPATEWPYIAVLHPVTSELQKHWNTVELQSFIEDLRQYIADYGSPDGTESSCHQVTDISQSPHKRDPILDASEESQIQAAIQASLREVETKKRLHEVISLDSDDSYEMETFTDESDNEVDSINSAHSSPRKKLKSTILKTSKETMDSAHHSGDSKLNQQTGSSSKEQSNDQKIVSRNWKDYVSESGDQVRIMWRLPDQSKQPWNITSDSKLKALILYADELGYNSQSYELITNFPRRKLSQMDGDKTLRESGLQNQETVYIQDL